MRPVLFAAPLVAAAVATAAWLPPPPGAGQGRARVDVPDRAVLIRLAAEDDGEAGRAAHEHLLDRGSLEGDLDLVLSALDEAPEALRPRYAALLVQCTERKPPAAAQGALLELLATSDVAARREVLGALWGVEMDAALAGRVVELARAGPSRLDALSLALCSMPSKTDAVVDLLLEATTDPDTAIRQRAWWGLGFGIPASRRGQVADHVLTTWDASAAPAALFPRLMVLMQCADDRHLADLERLAGDEQLGETVQQYARWCLEGVRKRGRE